ncbi:MAG: hypothetical protein P8J87_07150, partial [Verrucomicrobiales bacterium]|nr:hypothetical protein [Verrucomicrobiales bacterium]
MNSHRRILVLCAAGLLLASLPLADGADNKRLAEIRARVEPGLKRQLTRHGLPYGAPTFIRIFKQEKFLELWIQPKPGHPYQQFRRYPISNWGSGSLGPKLKEGDGQAPEGFYAITRQAMNPKSNF